MLYLAVVVKLCGGVKLKLLQTQTLLRFWNKIVAARLTLFVRAPFKI